MLDVPEYIQSAGIRGLEPGFKSDKSSVKRLYDVEVPAVFTRTRKTFERVKLAFAASHVEWIAWRLDGLADVNDLLQFAEGLWAAVVDYRYFVEKPRKEPDGPVPFGHVLFHTWQNANALYRGCSRADGNPNDCVALAALARHTLPKSHEGPYKEWLEFVLDRRLKALWAANPDEEDPAARLGRPVPRAAFDPALKYKPDMDAELLNAFLGQLDPKKNPYLRSPKDLKKSGFTGTPYQV